LTTFGTPRDITLEELSVELFYPADDATDAILRSAPAQVTASGG
ncbi:transcriptional regulator, partial [Acinetobacter baumannii]|nr:transcriptional regulator [Acinetobacter baumannii]